MLIRLRRWVSISLAICRSPDRRGHVGLLLPPSNTWMVYADDGAGGSGLAIQRGRRTSGVAALTLELGAPRAVRGIVLGRKREPLADVPVLTSFREYAAVFPGKPEQRVPRSHVLAEWWTPLQLDELRYVMSKVVGSTLSGPDGRFRVAVPPNIGGCFVYATDMPWHSMFVSGNAGGESSQEYRLELTRKLQ